VKRFKNILLVAEDHTFTSEAFAYTLELAEHIGASLSIIDVIDRMPQPGYDDLEDLWSGLRIEQIQRIAGGDVNKAGPIVIGVGTRFIEIIRRVLLEGYDLVVIPDAAEGYSSTTLHLLRKCPVPVWVMKPGHSGPRRILAAVDPDPTDPVRDSLNTLVMDLAISIAHRHDGELSIVHAWRLPGEATLRDAVALGHPNASVKIALARSAAEESARRNIDILLDGYDLNSLEHRVHLVNGSAGDVVPDVAASCRTDLIVMGTVARIDTPGLFIGPHAETIIENVCIPILAVKPIGFTTPVQLPNSGQLPAESDSDQESG